MAAKTSIIGALAALACAQPARAQAHDTGAWGKASDTVRTVLVAGSLGLPLARGDRLGLEREAEALAVTGGATWILKRAIAERRPDGSDLHSFPSGHTSISFAAAAGLGRRYGWKVGVPAHLAAAFVGLARVEADRHYWQDVIAGAALGEAAGQLIVPARKHQPAPIGMTMRIAF